jgi:sugar/nucleoside kinase (ribokinase family)
MTTTAIASDSSNKRFDVFGMCNALFDIQAEISDEQLTELSLPKGAMLLLDLPQQQAIVPRVYTEIVNTAAGGSGANTMATLALLGGKACYTSRIAPDEHGRMYREGLAKNGVQPNLGGHDGNANLNAATGTTGDGEKEQTGISLILITPDAQRTMCTYLGASRELVAGDVNIADIQASRYIYVTGYLWDTENQKEAVLLAMREARNAGVSVTLSLSDPFCVGRHKEDFTQLLGEYVDVVFANADEAKGMTGETDPTEAAQKLAHMTRNGMGIAVVTRDKTGSLICTKNETHEIGAFTVEAVDTTGAGDTYAAGVLYGLTQNLPLPIAGRLGAYLAAQVVAQIGPRLSQIDRAMVDSIIGGRE